MKTAVIVDFARTPIGRAHPDKGYFRQTRSDDLAAHCLRAILHNTAIDPREIEDVLFSAASQSGEQGLNVARNAALLAGLPFECAAATINRLCGGGLQTILQAAHSIQAGGEDVHLVGGMEHMHHLPMNEGWSVNPKLFQRTSPAALKMGATAEFLAKKHRISRRRQDEFALRSHQKAAAAQRAGLFKREIAPVEGLDAAGLPQLFSADQCVRPDTSLEKLASLPPVFVPEDGSVTAGNSSPLNDGAAALLMMSQQKAEQLQLTPLVQVRAAAVAGVEPRLMGTGPVPAVEKARRRAGLTLADLDLIELNEAFAVQVLSCLELLGIDEERVNIRGGALALGHPLGASGARIAATLISTMKDRQAALGMATMCVGMGQGVAVIFENCS